MSAEERMSFKRLLHDKVVVNQLRIQQCDNLLERFIDEDCGCTCCKDAAARLHTSRNLLDACWCHLSEVTEHCYCAFCRLCLLIRGLED